MKIHKILPFKILIAFSISIAVLTLTGCATSGQYQQESIKPAKKKKMPKKAPLSSPSPSPAPAPAPVAVAAPAPAPAAWSDTNLLERFGSDLIADYDFSRGLNDRTGISGKFNTKNTEMRDGGLYLNGIYSPKDGTPSSASARIQKINPKLFTLVVTFYPQNEVKREGYVITFGHSTRWLSLYINENANLELRLDNGRYVNRLQNFIVKKNDWNTYACSVDLDKKRIISFLNSVQISEETLPDNFELGLIGSRWEQSDKEVMFTNYSVGGTFKGIIKSVKIYSRSFDKTDFHITNYAEVEKPVMKSMVPEVKNFQSAQIGEKAVATYDLVAVNGEQQADVIVAIIIDGDRRTAETLKLTGDFGKGVKVGPGKKIVWNAMADLPPDFDGELSWDVKATKSSAPAQKKKKAKKTAQPAAK
jgi:hypothetical protein